MTKAHAVYFQSHSNVYGMKLEWFDQLIRVYTIKWIRVCYFLYRLSFSRVFLVLGRDLHVHRFCMVFICIAIKCCGLWCGKATRFCQTSSSGHKLEIYILSNVLFYWVHIQCEAHCVLHLPMDCVDKLFDSSCDIKLLWWWNDFSSIYIVFKAFFSVAFILYNFPSGWWRCSSLPARFNRSFISDSHSSQ